MYINIQSKGKRTPIVSSKYCSSISPRRCFDESFNYISIVGKLNYLEKGSRPDTSYATHQLARFTTDPREEQGKATQWVARCLHEPKDKGLQMKPDPDKGLEVQIDADFAGSNPDTTKSRHGYVIFYSGIRITWKSHLQTDIALRSTDAEYTGLSYSLQEAIPIINLLKKLKENKFNVND